MPRARAVLPSYMETSAGNSGTPLIPIGSFWEESVSPLAVGCPGLSNMQAGTSAVPVLRAVHLDVIFIFSLSSLACQG